MAVHPHSNCPYIICFAAAGELAQVARELHPDGKVVSKEQEKVGCWCTAVEGIEAEAVDIIFIVQLLSELSKLSFWGSQHRAAGGCAAGSSARRLLPFRLGAFAHTWCTR